jgi:pimeloyl-ACP methyl ester carboxylesterase
VLAFDRRGHGHTHDTDVPFHYLDMAEHAVAVLERLTDRPVHLVGWSDGGIVALLVALRRPDLVDRLVVIGTNFHVDGIHPLQMDEGSPIMQMLRAEYGERSPDGADHFPIVAQKFAAMVSTEPTLTTAELQSIAHPCLVLTGDDDLVLPEHSVALYQALPAGQLCVIPAASHGVVMERPERVGAEILEFLDRPEPPSTMIPIRRAR